MTEETKQSLQLAFEILRRTLIDNNCSVALSKSGISVFDTAAYMRTGKFDGITVDINSLVREDWECKIDIYTKQKGRRIINGI